MKTSPKIHSLALGAALLASLAISACSGSDNHSNSNGNSPATGASAPQGASQPATPTAKAFSLALFGDVPYGNPNPTAGAAPGDDLYEFKHLPQYLSAIASDKDVSVAFHVGDLHSGSENCTEVFDRAIQSFFSQFTLPLVYTPGDNEWEDCQVPKEIAGFYSDTDPLLGNVAGVAQPSYSTGSNKAGNPVDNLNLVRQLFFPAAGATLGSGALQVHSQALEGTSATDKQFVENVWWSNQGVVFATVNIPGGSNNGTDVWFSGKKPETPDTTTMTAQQATEVANRTQATEDWLNNAFDQAEAQKATALVIAEQADMWDAENLGDNPRLSQYAPYVDIIARRTAEFGKPVLVVNGDTHLYQSDNPLMPNQACVHENAKSSTQVYDATTPFTAATPCSFDPYVLNPVGTSYNVPNFHRIIVHGQTTPMEWTKFTFDPTKNAPNGVDAYGPFSWARQQVTLN